MMAKRYLWHIILVLTLLGSAACSSKPGSQSQDVPIIATVNGEQITEGELLLAAKQILGEHADMYLTPKLRQELIQSVVASRAMAQQMKAELSDSEKQAIQQRIKAYEEELYVKEYLQRHVNPQTLDDRVLQAYYDKNPAEFGGKAVKSFEMLKAIGSSTPHIREQQLALLEQIKQSKDWEAAAKKHRQGVLKLNYISSNSSPDALEANLARLLQQTPVGKHSDVTVIGHDYYLVRVLNERRVAPKPFYEAKESIRQKLLTVHRRDMLKVASEQALEKANVVYLDKPQPK